MDDSTLIGAVAAVAAIAGPAIAVWITRWSDDRKEIRARRMDIFRTLMRTRKMPVHYDHVGALNLVEVEFYNEAQVIGAWKEYLKNLGENIPGDLPESELFNFRKKRDSLLTKLIYEISRVLNFRVDQLDILEGNYLPQGWNDEEWQQRTARGALLDVLSGRRALLVQQYIPERGVGPYPPAPSADGTK